MPLLANVFEACSRVFMIAVSLFNCCAEAETLLVDSLVSSPVCDGSLNLSVGLLPGIEIVNSAARQSDVMPSSQGNKAHLRFCRKVASMLLHTASSGSSA